MSAISWFEISVTDIDRAQAFYEVIMGVKLHRMDMSESMGSILAQFPGRGGIGGALVQSVSEDLVYNPSLDGQMVYLVVDDIDDALEKTEANGGKVALPKMGLGEMDAGAYTAWIIDTEGNRVGIYSKTEVS
jgi:hypothetical protein